MKRSLMSLSLVCVLLSLLVGSQGVRADSLLPPPVEIFVVERTDFNELLAVGGEDKAAVVRALQTADLHQPLAAAADSAQLTLWEQHHYYSANQTTPFYNAYIWTWYNNTHVHLQGSPFNLSATIDGQTQTLWTGCQPSCYSDAIKLRETWSFLGSSLRLSVGGGGLGGAWSIGGNNQMLFDAGWVNTSGWASALSHSYSGVRASSNVSLYGVDHSAMGSHRIGANIATAVANGGVRWWIW